MPPPPDRQDEIAQAYYTLQAQAGSTAVEQVVALVLGIDLADFDAGWLAVREQVLRLLIAQQLRAAVTSDAFFTALLALFGMQPAPLATVPPAAFAGWTSAGLPLSVVIDTTPVVAKIAVAAGATPANALAVAGARLSRIAASEVQDAGRGMLEARGRLEPKAHAGYVRRVSTPACGRCLLLAGRVYRWSTGFARHPGCDCQMIPALVAHPDTPDPRELFHRMTDAEQEKAVGKAAARAIRDGADPSSVVNAGRGMSRPGELYTSEATTKRGAFYRQQKDEGRLGQPRLSPQGVALKAGDDTVRYRQLLKDNAYIT